MRVKSPPHPCEWCGKLTRRRGLRICETCARDSIRTFLSMKEKGVSGARPFPSKTPQSRRDQLDPQAAETPSTISAQLHGDLGPRG